MLGNELRSIEELVSERYISGNSTITENDINSQFTCIRNAWERVAFSNITEHSLVRYFNYHLEGISKISDTLFILRDVKDFENVQSALLSLVDRLKIYYSPYFNLETNAPVAYHQRLMNKLAGSIGMIRENMELAGLDPNLKICLVKWLAEMSETGDNVQYSFRSLDYLEYLIRQLPSIDLHSENAEDRLITLLSRLNFNHLAFFVYRQNNIRNSLNDLNSTGQQLDYLHQQRAAVLSCPEVKNLVFDSNWPSLKIMMSEWLHEEIRLGELAAKKESETKPSCNIQKLPLDLPVSQLACLIRLFFEESKFATENLKVIFSFFAANYQTKRQPVISPGSLSKEFYSIDQQTAARVRDLLQKMVLRINRNFFPVVVAIGIAIHVYPGTR